MFTYTGLMTLCGVIIVCIYIIIEKLNEVRETVINSKKVITNIDSNEESY